MPWQQTLQHKMTLTGIGLHTGQTVACELVPATTGTGIVLVRTDLPGQPEIAANVHNLLDVTLATTLGVPHLGGQAHVGTVEHLLAALSAMGVDNARVLINGPEVPVLDGSALPWVHAICSIGVEAQAAPRHYWRVRKEVRVTNGHKWAALAPHPGQRITCALDFDHPLIAATPFRYDLDPKTFVSDIAPARTFCFRNEISHLQARGLARGGSLKNAIVIDGYQVLNPEGLRFADEFVRHKVLDAVGDLSLMGLGMLGKVDLHCSGHALNTELVRAALADPQAMEKVTFGAPIAAESNRAVATSHRSLAGLTALTP